MLPYFFHIIANETAGAYHGKQNIKQVVQYLQQAQIDFELHKTAYAGQATTLAKAIHGPFYDSHQHILLVIGGDGTLHQVITGLQQQALEHPIPIGYIPSGSGNDFSRSLGLSRNPITNLQRIIQTTHSQTLDIGILHRKHQAPSVFINNIGIGIDARTVFLTNHSKAKTVLNHLKMGTFSYLANLLRAYRQQKSFNVTVHTSAGTQTFHNIFLVTFGNEPYFGGGVPILPKATFHNHLIDLILVEKLPFKQLVPLFYKVFKNGTHLTHPKVHYFQEKTYHVQTDRLEYGQIDGEELGHQAFDFKISLAQYPFWF